MGLKYSRFFLTFYLLHSWSKTFQLRPSRVQMDENNQYFLLVDQPKEKKIEFNHIFNIFIMGKIITFYLPRRTIKLIKLKN